MTRLQKTNHVLFLVLASVGLLLGTVILVNRAERAYDRWFGPPRDEILSTDRAEDLAEKDKRLNVVSTSDAELLDPSRSLYLVPISQERLREPKNIRRGETVELRQTQQPRRNDASAPKWQSYRVAQEAGPFNNLVLCRGSTGETTMLFNERTGVTRYLVVDDPTSYSLFVLLASSDTNGDGVLRPDDRRSLVEYRFETGARRVLTDSSRHIRDLRYRARDQSLFVTVGIDYDGNGTFEGRTEPTRLYRVDRNAGTLTPVVADSTRRRLQSILDSRP
jgi:hypothetical protein